MRMRCDAANQSWGRPVAVRWADGKRRTSLKLLKRMPPRSMMRWCSAIAGLGLTLEHVTATLADQKQLPRQDGFLVTAVAPDSIGDRAGILVGDVIFSAGAISRDNAGCYSGSC